MGSDLSADVVSVSFLFWASDSVEAAPRSVTSSGFLRAGNGLKALDGAFAGGFPFGFGHVRTAVPELHACRQTLATAARGLRQWNTRTSAGRQSCRYGGGVRG